MVENIVTKQLEEYAATRGMDYSIRLRDGKLYLIWANGFKLNNPVYLGKTGQASEFIKNVTTNDTYWEGSKRNQH